MSESRQRDVYPISFDRGLVFISMAFPPCFHLLDLVGACALAVGRRTCEPMSAWHLIV
jgi:hypothetical protein